MLISFFTRMRIDPGRCRRGSCRPLQRSSARQELAGQLHIVTHHFVLDPPGSRMGCLVGVVLKGGQQRGGIAARRRQLLRPASGAGKPRPAPTPDAASAAAAACARLLAAACCCEQAAQRLPCAHARIRLPAGSPKGLPLLRSAGGCLPANGSTGSGRVRRARGAWTAVVVCRCRREVGVRGKYAAERTQR